MNLNEETIGSIRKWVKIDNEINILKQEIASRKKIQNDITNNFHPIVIEKGIDVVNTNDGQLKFIKRKTKKPISKKLLQNILSKYYKDDVNKAAEINDLIWNNQEESSKDIIVRKIDK